MSELIDMMSPDRGVATTVKVLTGRSNVLTSKEYRTFPADLEKNGCPQSFAINAAILVSMWVAILADSPLTDELGYKPVRLVDTFHKYLLTNPITGVIRHFASLSDELLDNIEGTANHGYIIHWLSDFRDTPIFKEYHEFVRTGDPELLAYILTFLQLGKRVEADIPELEAIAFRRWLEDEERLESFDQVYEAYGTFDALDVPQMDLYTEPSIMIDELRALAHHLIPDHWTCPFFEGQVRIRRCCRYAAGRSRESEQLRANRRQSNRFCGPEDDVVFSSLERQYPHYPEHDRIIVIIRGPRGTKLAEYLYTYFGTLEHVPGLTCPVSARKRTR